MTIAAFCCQRFPDHLSSRDIYWRRNKNQASVTITELFLFINKFATFLFSSMYRKINLSFVKNNTLVCHVSCVKCCPVVCYTRGLCLNLTQKSYFLEIYLQYLRNVSISIFNTLAHKFLRMSRLRPAETE